MMVDKLKIGASMLLLIAGMVAYYMLPKMLGQEVSIFIRLGVMVAAVVLAGVVAASSQYGASAIEFVKGANVERRKMVWPTRPETIQMTIVVMVSVFLVGLFLYLIDLGVFKVIYDLLLGIKS